MSALVSVVAGRPLMASRLLCTIRRDVARALLEGGEAR
jgi:hypothetical protein